MGLPEHGRLGQSGKPQGSRPYQDNQLLPVDGCSRNKILQAPEEPSPLTLLNNDPGSVCRHIFDVHETQVDVLSLDTGHVKTVVHIGQVDPCSVSPGFIDIDTGMI